MTKMNLFSASLPSLMLLITSLVSHHLVYAQAEQSQSIQVQPNQTQPTIEVLAELDQRPGNPAVMPNGDIYISMHPFDNPQYKIMKIEDGKATPYPNEAFSQSFYGVIGIQATQNNELWWLEMGSADISPKLIGWNTEVNQLRDIYVFPKEVSVENSFYQDFAIDQKRNKAFIADMTFTAKIENSQPGIIVLDLRTGYARRVLNDHPFLKAEDTPIVADGKPLTLLNEQGEVLDLRLALNPITIDPQSEWVYFAAMTAGKLYRVPAAVLGDLSKTSAEIAEAIEVYGTKPTSDGMAAAKEGKVYVTDLEKNGISVVDQQGTRLWVTDPKMIWPDGLYVAPDQSVIATINQLNRIPVFNQGQSTEQKPFQVLRIREQK